MPAREEPMAYDRYRSTDWDDYVERQAAEEARERAGQTCATCKYFGRIDAAPWGVCAFCPMTGMGPDCAAHRREDPACDDWINR